MSRERQRERMSGWTALGKIRRDRDTRRKAVEMGGQGSFMIRPGPYLTMRPAQRLHRTEERASRPGGG